MRTLAVTVLLALAGPARAGEAGAPPAADLVVTLRPAARVEAGRAVPLGALADLGGEGASRAAAIEVVPAPVPGRRAVVAGGDVLRALANAGWARGSVRLGGAREVRVTAEGQPLDAARVKSAVADLVRSAAPRGTDVKVTDLRIPDGPLVEVGPYAVEVEKPQGGFRPGIVQIPVTVRSQGGSVRRLAATARIEMTAPVVVALRDVPRGAPVSAADLAVEPRPVPARDRFLSDVHEAEGLVARAALRQGQPVPASAVGRAAAVEPGQMVRALVKQGAVLIDLQTTCRGRGDVGAIVPVASPDGHKLVRARVIGPGRVQVLGSEDVPGAPAPPAAGPPAGGPVEDRR